LCLNTGSLLANCHLGAGDGHLRSIYALWLRAPQIWVSVCIASTGLHACRELLTWLRFDLGSWSCLPLHLQRLSSCQLGQCIHVNIYSHTSSEASMGASMGVWALQIFAERWRRVASLSFSRYQVKAVRLVPNGCRAGLTEGLHRRSVLVCTQHGPASSMTRDAPVTNDQHGAEHKQCARKAKYSTQSTGITRVGLRLTPSTTHTSPKTARTRRRRSTSSWLRGWALDCRRLHWPGHSIPARGHSQCSTAGYGTSWPLAS
jgi:hypothetical protein